MVLARVLEALQEELDRGIELVARVSRVEGVRKSPVALAEHVARKAVRDGRKEGGGTADEALVHEGDFEEVLGEGAGVNVVVVTARDAAEEGHGSRPAELKVELVKHKTLGLQNLLGKETIVDHEAHFLKRRAGDFLILCSNEQGCDAAQLELAERDDLDREETVDIVAGQEESLGAEVETGMDLDEPVQEDGAHGPLELILVVHVVGVGKHLVLEDC